MIRMNPYLNFGDQARDAMEFYRATLGGALELSTFAEGGMPGLEPAERDKVMHASLETPDGLVLMASDTPAAMGQPSGNGTVSLSGDDEARLQAVWDRLTDGGNVVAPLEAAPWGDRFGMCTDRFGIAWMVNISPAPS